MPASAAPTSRLASRAALAAGAALACVVGVGLARRSEPAVAAPVAAPEPAADFVVAAGDSTYWVTRPAGAAGEVHVRTSPLFLARWGGRLAEVYVTDDERAFDDGAWFAAQRVYRRDLLTGDSALVFADPAVPRLAARYAAAHPGARLLDPDESPPEPDSELDAEGDSTDDHGAAGAEAAVALVAVHGPYLSLEQRTTGTRDDVADAVARRVLDLRTGAEASLAALFGAPAAERLAGAGRAALRDAVDALRPAARRAVREADRAAARAQADEAGDSGNEPVDRDAPRRALAALGTLAFDPANFGLTERGGAPAVAFVALGRDADGAAVTLALPPVAVPGPAPAWWRDEVAPALLVGGGADAGAGAGPRVSRWRPARGAYEVRARPAAGAAGAASLELVSAPAAPAPSATPNGSPNAGTPNVGTPNGAPGAAPNVAPGVAPGAARVWPLARVPAGPAQLFPLDDARTRRALRRAFDESAFYDDATTSVAWRPGRRPAPGRPATGHRTS